MANHLLQNAETPLPDGHVALRRVHIHAKMFIARRGLEGDGKVGLTAGLAVAYEEITVAAVHVQQHITVLAGKSAKVPRFLLQRGPVDEVVVEGGGIAGARAAAAAAFVVIIQLQSVEKIFRQLLWDAFVVCTSILAPGVTLLRMSIRRI